MRFVDRLTLALLLVLGDTLVLVIPLAALLIAYVLLARPAWFRDWVDRVYRDVPRRDG